MKIEIDDEIMYQIKDTIMVEFLKEDLNTIQNSSELYWHDDDVKYDKKLIKAYKTILKYYGVSNE